ncbi:hypothetical protein [Blastopirellula marina]|uniref:Uncharacterized protein n=1 Tax=Blastopirellula marina TaxID=124 RepID=A0A2S8GCR2_9BACT|nr:hypothetical protein [Blastopirellula marina]PQO42090.1 hypothetical protein C5Y93_27455 [Blastopirellula marina]
MTFTKYLNGNYDPTSVGSVDLNTEHVAQKNLFVILFKVFASAVVSAGLFWIPFQYLPLHGWQSIVVASGIMLLYIGVSFFCIPKPDTGNLGFFGGLADNPFRYSDDINRGLMFFGAILMPGRFVAGTVLDVAVHFGICKSDPVPCSYDYYEQQYEAMGYNAKMTELDPAEPEGLEPAATREENHQQQYGLSSARFLINDDE